MEEKDRCSLINNMDYHLAIDLNKLEKDHIKIEKEIDLILLKKKLREERRKDPYLKIAIWMIILGIILIISSLI